MYLLDSDILLNLMKRAPSTKLIARLASVPAEHQFTSTIALGELIYGAHRLRKETAILLERLESTLLPNLTVLPFDAAAARRYGEVRAELEGQGIRVGDADLRIGAIALARGLTVVAGNMQRFQRIPGLAVESWLEQPVAAGRVLEEPVGNARVSEEPASVPSVEIECSLRGGNGQQQGRDSPPAENAGLGIRWIWPPE